MNKTAIKSFAVRARNKLIEGIIQKAYELGITKEEIKDIEIFEGGFKIIGLDNSKTYKKYEIKQRNELLSSIKDKGFEQVIEEVAYTWFNRCIALRFMEVNEYLPTGVRVLSSIEEGKTEPDIIKEALNIDLDIDHELVYKIIDKNDTEDLYKYLFIKQCNQLGKIMPIVFEEISDYTELLLPDNLLSEGSVIKDLVESIDEEDYKEQVEIIGWMYQYYISELNNLVYDGDMSKKKIPKDLLPAATQLFTPEWPVRYMVENSIGHLWLNNSYDAELKSKWEYYLENINKDTEALEKLNEQSNVNLKIENIKIIDPCMGSGHILVYAFDVLYDIYLKLNYSEREIPQLILEKNLYGLDIDDRAGQLAAFALMMKARSKNRRIFRNKIELNVCSIQESNFLIENGEWKIDNGFWEYFCNSQCTTHNAQLKKDIEYLVEVFHDAKEYGSILDVRKIDFDAIDKRIEEIRNGDTLNLFELKYRDVVLERIQPLVKQGRYLNQKYDVVITNPPYLGNARMNPKLTEYVSKNYPDVKSDLSMVMYKKAIESFSKVNGYISFITTSSWMYLKSFEEIRKFTLQNLQILSLVDFGTELFDGKVGHNPIVAWVSKKSLPTQPMLSIRLVEFCYSRRDEKKDEFFNLDNRHLIDQHRLFKIPGMPIAYWVSDNFVNNFDKGISIDKISDFTGSQHITANNNLYLRYFWEVNKNLIGENNNWAFYAKGGEYRKWFGNIQVILKTTSHAINFYKTNKTSNMLDEKYWFVEGITYSAVTSKSTGFRYYAAIGAFDKGGPSISYVEKLEYVLGLLNSKVAQYAFTVLNPTINLQVKDIKSLPIIICNQYETCVYKLVGQNIAISKTDWDSFETSCDFKKHPLINEELRMEGIELKQENNTIEEVFNQWNNFTNNQFNKLKSNEEELNRIFIEIYGLQDELTPEVEDKDVTIRKVDRERDIKSFISYAVGCMFGRYSLDEEGLIYAGGEFKDKYKTQDGELRINTTDGWRKSSIDVTMDNVIPIVDDDYFEDDIVNRFMEFVKVTFGEKTLEENLGYIADTLGNKSGETSRQTIRRYFLKDFYTDHVKTYSKRPIYWLFDSGKNNGFKALIYMHRYDSLTVARVRTDYLHKLQRKYEAEVAQMDILLESEISTREKANAKKRKDNVNKQILECRSYDQVIAHIANQKIEIDLDDGVVVNYAKFQSVEIPQGEGKKPIKADLLGKI